MDEQGAMEDRCGNCNASVPEDSGYENGRGDLLCTQCFVDQWGPSSEELVRDFETGVGVSTPQAVTASPFWGDNDFGGLELS
jgi:hypothetical protein